MADEKTTDSYGSARWAGAEDLASEGIMHFPARDIQRLEFSSVREKASLLAASPKARSFILGRLGDPAKLTKGIRYDQSKTSDWYRSIAALFDGRLKASSSEYLGWAGDGHILTVAPTRSGKGIGLVIPNLLNYPGSVLVVDPKGENYAVTHRYRRDVLGQKVVCLDPFHVMIGKDAVSDSINPFDGIVDYSLPPSTYLSQNPELIDEANLIADALIMREPREKDPHWNDKCRTLLKGLVLAVICGYGPNKRRHLSEVRALLTSGYDDLIGLFGIDMAADVRSLGGALSRAAKEILSMGGEEFKNVISFALKHTEFLDTPIVGECLGSRRQGFRGTYNLRNLKKSGGVSIYMILPPHYLARYVRLFRLWITMAMASMTRTFEKPADGCPVLFMLDEMAQLGTMDMMRQAVSLLAGYGMSLWMIWQDLSQLKALYEHDWPSFIANAKIQQFFGINDHETAKYISEMLGKATIKVFSRSGGTSHSKENLALLKATDTVNKSESVAEKERDLLSADEVRRLNREAMLMFVQGIPPILAERISYFRDSMFASRFDRNPYV